MRTIALVFSSIKLVLLGGGFVVGGCGARSDLDDSSEAKPQSNFPAIVVSDAAHDGTSRLVGFDSFESTTWKTYDAKSKLVWCNPAFDREGRLLFGQLLIEPTAPDIPSLVRIDDLTGKNLVSFGKPGSGRGEFITADDPAIDAFDRIYISDDLNNRIVRIDDMSGAGWVTFTAPRGSGEHEFDQIGGLAVSSTGKIVFGDFRNGRVVIIDDITGAGWRTIRLPAVQGPAVPIDLAIDSEDRIYVVDFDSRRLYRFDDFDETPAAIFTVPANPYAVSVATDGRIYLAGPTSIFAMDDMQGTNLVEFTGPVGSTDRIAEPCGIGVH